MKKFNYILLISFLLFLAFNNLIAQEQLAALNTKQGKDILLSAKDENFCERKNNDMSKCLSCHKKNGWENKKYLHAPIAMNECRPCHIAPDNIKTKELQVALDKTPCLFCHEKDEIKKIHPEKLSKDKPNCTGCHNPHASDKKYFLR